MVGDSLIEAVRSIVLRVLDDHGRIDYRALYPAKVDAQAVAGGPVDVTFDDPKLDRLPGVRLAPGVGETLALAPQTRVLIGWLGGDEDEPRAYLGWDGAGGLTSSKLEASASVAVVAPQVNLGTDPGGSFVMLGGVAVPAQATLFAAFSAGFTAGAAGWTAAATAFTAIAAAGVAAVPCAAAATAATAAATACSAAAAAVTAYASNQATYIATRVRAT